MIGTKRCTKCGLVKALTEFGQHRLTKDGHAYRCKQCAREHSKKHRKTPRGIYSALKALQNFHKRKPVVITKDEFVKWYNEQTRRCHYCGIHEEDLYLFAEKYHSRYSRLTVDCMDNEAGYVLGNIVLACDKCNITKNNMLTYEEMLYIGKRYIRSKWVKLKPKE